GPAIGVSFRSLERAFCPGGTAYFSRHRPQVVVDGQSLTVAFSRHAIEQMCKRLTVSWPSYAALGDVFSFLDQCLEFERFDLHGGQLGFTFFEECGKRTWKYHLAELILGEEFDSKADYCYRVGYCPAVVENGFLKAKT